MEAVQKLAKEAAIATGIIGDDETEALKHAESVGNGVPGSPDRMRKSYARPNSENVDKLAIGFLAKMVVQVDHNGVPYSRNTKWNVLAQTLHLAKWNGSVVEAALKGVKPFAKTESSKDHCGVLRFYNQMLWSGKEKALKVICTTKHCTRLEKCTLKTDDKVVSKQLQQFLSDWIEMYDNLHSCEDFYLIQRHLTFLSHPNRCSIALARCDLDPDPPL